MNRTLSLSLIFLSLAAACSSRSDSTENKDRANPRSADPRARSGKAHSRPKSLRAGNHVVRSLVKEAVRAELWQRGVFVDMGTRDQHKYTLGGYRSGWRETHRDGEVTHTDATIASSLRFHLPWSGPQKVLVRARSQVKGQVLSLSVDGSKVGGRKMSAQWDTHVFELDGPLSMGRHDLSFRLLKHGGKKKPPAQIDWVWLATAKAKASAPPKPVKVSTLNMGRPRRALVGSGSRRYSFYLVVPPKSVLVFDYGADEETTFRVQVTADGKTSDSPTKTVFEKKDAPKKWKEARVDLAAWSGQLVRLDFITAGPAKAGWGEPEIMRPGPRPKLPVVTQTNRAKNLVVIVIDTARKDAYQPFAEKTRVKAPAMKALASESVWFDAAYANAPWTKPSTATILSGLYPATHKAEEFRSVLPQEVTLLSEHLQKRGFVTGAFLGNAFISDDFGFNKGWSHFSNYAREDKPTEAMRLYKDALAWVEKRDPSKRFFLYMQTMDPHVPYAVPKKYLDDYYEGSYDGKLGEAVTGDDTKDFNAGRIELTADDKRYTRALYDGEITYHDHYLGKFVETLRKRNLLQDTLFVVTNDHGEELFERGELGHGHSLFDEQVAAPFLMRYPKILPKNRRVDTPVALVDLPATLLELLAVEQMDGMEGQSMRPVIFGQLPQEASYAVCDLSKHPRTMRLKRSAMAVRLGRYKLIVSKKKSYLFDIEKDPEEKNNLADTHSVARRGCEAYLGEGIAIPSKYHRLSGAIQKKKFEPGKAKIDPKLRRQLQALAYTN